MFLVSYCNADDQVITHIDTEFTDDTYIHYDEIPKLDNKEVFGPDAVRDFNIVMGFGLTTLQLNFVGSLYVIYRIYVQWKRDGRTSISLSLRFPFYIALTELYCCLETSMVESDVWNNRSQRSNIIYAQHVPCGYYSFDNMVSRMQRGLYRFRAIRLQTLDFNDCIIDYCRMSFVQKLDDLLTSNNSTPRRAHIEKRALRKLISYIFTFILQFFENVLLYMLATTTINFGGIGNFFQFLINEGFSSSTQMSSQTSSMGNPQQINSFGPEETKTTGVREIGNNEGSTAGRVCLSLEFGEKFDENIVKDFKRTMLM
ncbi:6959_t:CDS:2 [Funneliformis geosporum]|uniref:6959_t:CDS:1 n=1 Tax=Funneliformis geosporum TaxID=1117311 RepID=A0A9W4SRM5_9GLOM|nr:6959_t:CDS:2 [Funneliformis geosporum]